MSADRVQNQNNLKPPDSVQNEDENTNDTDLNTFHCDDTKRYSIVRRLAFSHSNKRTSREVMKSFSIFMEFFAILMALHYICNIQLAIFNFLIYFDSKSFLYALRNWDCKMTGDILIHCIMSRGIGIEFCWVPSLLERNIS